MKYRLLFSAVLLVTVFVATPVSAVAAQPGIQVSEVVFEKGTKAPTCKVLLTYKRPRAGEMSTILWRSTKADYMTGLFTAEKRPSRGSQNVTFGNPGLQTFDLKFTGPGGITTCTMQVHVREKVVTE